MNIRLILSGLAACAVLCAMPGTTRAQIFVTSYGGVIGEYTTSGATVNASLVSGAGNLNGIAVSGGDLFVANYYGTVGEYTTSGATVNAALVSGLRQPYPIAASGNLFVGDQADYSIHEYTTSGAEVIVPPTGNPPTEGIPIGNVGIPYGIVVSGGFLFVAKTDAFGNNGSIVEYDIVTGNTVNAFLVGGLVNPLGIAVSGGNLFVVDNYSGTISEYTAAGVPVKVPLVSGLHDPVGIAVSGGNLFVVERSIGTIGEYDATSGATVNATLVSGLNFPRYIAVGAESPLANAGPNRTVQAGTLVTLDGSGSSDPSGQLPLTYAWSFVSKPAGSAVTLSNPSIVNPTFTPDALGNYVIQLVVTDAAGLSSAPATVTISTTDAPPVANAGPNQTITAVGALVQLNGSSSYDLAGLPITYQWSFVSKPAGSSTTLTGPTTATPTFVADLAGNYTLQLVVTDSLGTASSPAEVTISFSDVPPVANAGTSQSTVVGESVTLNGSRSTDTNGAPLTYQWSVVSAPSGSKTTISNPTAEIASFVPDLPGTYVVQLIVNDGTLNSLPATTEIVAVSQQTSLTEQISNLQGVIAHLPPSAFRNVVLKEALLIELNAVVLSVGAKHYNVALLVLQDVIMPEVNECATTGAPGKGWINNCPDQSKVYTPLLNIIAEVKSLCGC